VEDIREFDEGLLEQINFLKNEIDQETFENSLNKTYCIELTDNSLFELIQGGNEKKVNFDDRFTYMKLLIKARLTESDTQIAAIKRGLCKIVPYSLIKCKFLNLN